MYISASNKSITQKAQSMKTKSFSSILKFTHKKHKNKTNITQLPGTYTFMAYLREIKKQKVVKSEWKEKKIC